MNLYEATNDGETAILASGAQPVGVANVVCGDGLRVATALTRLALVHKVGIRHGRPTLPAIPST